MSIVSTQISNLNPEQQSAIKAEDGPVLVLAGPGAGKTKVIVSRIELLLKEGVRPDQIMVLTFTTKAAEELTSRLVSMVGRKAKSIWAGTFHSSCLKILRQEAHHIGYPEQFWIADDDDSSRMLHHAVEEAEIDPDLVNFKSLPGIISGYKSHMLEPDEVHGEMGQLYGLYQDALFANAMMDFDDLLLNTVKVFNDEKILRRWQKKFKHILVDEFQDTDHVQYILSSMLSAGCRSLYVVGDVEQSIYSFRGADIENILHFHEDFPGAQVYKLEQNYRSTKKIVAAVNKAASSSGELAKQIWTENGEGEDVVVKKCYDESDEAFFILNEIVRQNYSLSDICILGRTHSVLEPIEKTLKMNSVPYKVIGQMAFNRRKEVKDIMAYVKLVIDPSNDDALMRIINVPKRGIGDSTIQKMLESKKDTNSDLFSVCKNIIINSTKTTNALREFVALIEGLRQLPLETGIIQAICEKTGYIGYLEEDEEYERIANIKTLLRMVEDYKGQPLRELLDYLALLGETKSSPDVVSLMTIHGAKGLEFPIVFVAGCNENIFPHFLAEKNGTVDEERRLFYVAISRAMERLYATYTQYRTPAGKPIRLKPSRFLKLLEG
jgi:DNA helicase-2/ATP-dependent DNA helicase PcrA